jgi:hypothetical protein
MELGDLLADAVEYVAADDAFGVGDDRGSELDDDGHGAKYGDRTGPSGRPEVGQLTSLECGEGRRSACGGWG